MTTPVAAVTAEQIAFWTRARLGVKALLNMGPLMGSLGTLKLVLTGPKRLQVLVALEPSDTYSVTFGYVGRGKRAGEWIELSKTENVYADSLNRVLEADFATAAYSR